MSSKERFKPLELTLADDLEALFLNEDHWIHSTPGTPSDLGPDSVFHIGQLEVLFESKYLHWRTSRALLDLRAEGTLVSEDRSFGSGTATLVWHKTQRYVRRKVNRHLELLEAYSADLMSRACGVHAETLVRLLLAEQGGTIESRNARSFDGREWERTAHDLDFIATVGDRAFGIEVKNTFPYMDEGELALKLDMCRHLRIEPLFIVRHWHPGQRRAAREARGEIFMFQTKVFPPGQDDLTASLWREMRLPVKVRTELPVALARAVQRRLRAPSP